MATELMTRQDRAVLADYLRATADVMGLRDWALEIGDDLPDDEATARVNPTYGRKHACILFCRGFRSLSAEEQRDTVVHELVHLHLEPVDNMMRDDLEDLIGKPADHIFWKGYRRQLEYGVDGLAGAIAKHLPLISWP